MDDRPLKPSMMLTELATPATVNTVAIQAPAAVATTQSRPGTSVRVMVAPSSQMPRAAETAVASSRLAGETRFVRSSIKPARKAGRPQTMSSAPSFQSRWCIRNATATQQTRPVNIPTPPMRGTGAA
jgi:hypothetical protein